jgi:hypothetical protein
MTSKMKIGLFAAGAIALTAGGATLNARSGEARGPMAKFDSDSNGAITLAEARAGAAKMFEGADSNRDGRATHEEMMAFHGKMGAHHKGGHGDKAGRGGHGEKRGKGPMHLDSDGDGALTLAEAQSGIEAHFAKIDSNRDGSIDEAEMRAAHEAHRGGR